MDLTAYVDALRNSLRTAAAAGGEQAQETARLLSDAMEPAVRLAVLDALSAMAAEVTAALDGDVVEIRLRGREPE
ncbi:MAG: toxin-antitoxin system HicB family antitoxin, partial [Geodermatophilales bacterium]|nr:toxin-antitoxin system HicB family antitoxin [Geodermatophilales bacterium]